MSRFLKFVAAGVWLYCWWFVCDLGNLIFLDIKFDDAMEGSPQRSELSLLVLSSAIYSIVVLVAVLPRLTRRYVPFLIAAWWVGFWLGRATQVYSDRDLRVPEVQVDPLFPLLGWGWGWSTLLAIGGGVLLYVASAKIVKPFETRSFFFE